MRVIDCDCGETLQAASDDELSRVVRQHADDAHPGLELDEEQAREMVAEQAYEAADA